MTKDEIKAALRLALDRVADALTETPWTLLLAAAWTVGMVVVGYAICAL